MFRKAKHYSREKNEDISYFNVMMTKKVRNETIYYSKCVYQNSNLLKYKSVKRLAPEITVMSIIQKPLRYKEGN